VAHVMSAQQKITVAPAGRHEAAWWEGLDRAFLILLRVFFLLFVTYDGVLIVRNVTRALCDVDQRPPPAWTDAGGR